MVSPKMSVAIMVVCFVAATQALHSDKCKFNPDHMSDEDRKIGAECFMEATGKPFDAATVHFDELSEDVNEKMCECASTKSGVFGADGSFNAEKAKEHFAKLESSEETKKAVNAGIDECAKAGGDLKTIKACLKALMKKECGD